MDANSIRELKVYPPLGLARVGNAKDVDDYVIGTEVIGGPATKQDGTPARYVEDFRTPDFAIKRQAARFRIYAHLNDGSVVEVTADDAKIEWHVAVANLKAGWYEFNQAMDLPLGLSQNAQRRNRTVAIPGGRKGLDIVPTSRKIEGRHAEPVLFDDGVFSNKQVTLGELRTDGQGRLLFLGGSGVSAPFRSHLRPLTFANNDGWHDDICDGPVRAVVTFANGKQMEATPGYVAVTPPNYAPGVIGLVTMDDAVRETFQNQGWVNVPSTTSFTEDVWPIFDRLTGLQWINHGLFVVHGYGSPLDARNPAVMEKLCNAEAVNESWRQAVFKLFRDPNIGGALVEPQIPQVFGDGVDELFEQNPADGAISLLSVTPTQYAHLERWARGMFTADWPGTAPVPPLFTELLPDEQVAHLERATLHDCLGGPFHPGIELTWVMRLPRLWSGAYRLNVLPGDGPARQDFGEELTPAECIGPDGPFDGVAAGALTRFMGVPWQTDGTSCNSSADYFPTTFLSMPTFWGARVPDQVLSQANYVQASLLDPHKLPLQIQKHLMSRVDWLRDVRGADYFDRIDNMVHEWAELGMVLPVESPKQHLPVEMRVEQGRHPRAAGYDPKIEFVNAIETLGQPPKVQREGFTAQGLETTPRLPPKRTFRQGEI